MRVSMRPWPFSTVVVVTTSSAGAVSKYVRDLGFEGGLVAFQGEDVIGLVGDDLVGDLHLAAHGIDRDQGALELPGLGQ